MRARMLAVGIKVVTDAWLSSCGPRDVKLCDVCVHECFPCIATLCYFHPLCTCHGFQCAFSTSPSGLNLLACVTRCRCGLRCSPLQNAMFFQATIALTSGPPLAMCPHSCQILLRMCEDHLCSPILWRCSLACRRERAFQLAHSSVGSLLM